MSGVIKLGGVLAGKVRAMPGDGPPGEQPVSVQPGIDPELTRLGDEVARLSTALKKAVSENEQGRAEVERASLAGEARGREAGLKAAQDGRDQAMKALHAGIDLALSRLADETASMERLSAALAREALAKVLGDSARYSEFIQLIIRRQIELIEDQSILHVEVSSKDFGEDPETLKTVAGRSNLRVIASDDLAAGDCRIKLQLGEIDVGVGQQWRALSSALSEIAEPGSGR